jgi:Arc/MetJ-type ribon-helix-helix transcriptional regulator
VPDPFFSDAEHLEHAELQAVLSGLKLNRFDPYDVIRTPSQDRGKDTDMVSFRLSKHMNRVIALQCGLDRRFTDKSEFIRHYLAVGLMVESAIAPEEAALRSLIDPFLARIRIENNELKRKAWDDSYEALRRMLQNTDGYKERRECLEELRILQRTAVAEGWLLRIQQVSELLAREDS